MKDDAKLVNEALADGAAAFGPIVEKYQDAVFGVALARLGNFHDAQDVAQAVFVDAFSRLERLRDPAKLGSWLRRMAVNKSVDHIRRRKETVGVDQIDRNANPGRRNETTEKKELRDEVLAAIGRLSKTQRETVTLFYINGYSVSEVAGMQDVPVGTVKRRLHDAREKLKEDMMSTVEHVLKSEAPKEDFGQRVYEILSRYGDPAVYGKWEEVTAELRKIGAAGTEGFIRALQSPEARIRTAAAHMIDFTDVNDETVIELMKKALTDPNRKVRRFAGEILLDLNVDHERKSREFVPLVVPLLADRSKRVRQSVAWGLLRGYVDVVPLAPVAKAVLNETNPVTRDLLEWLLRAILEREDKKAEK